MRFCTENEHCLSISFFAYSSDLSASFNPFFPSVNTEQLRQYLQCHGLSQPLYLIYVPIYHFYAQFTLQKR